MPRHRGRTPCWVLALLVALGVPASARAASPPEAFRPFAPDSIFNLPLRDDAPLAARSAEWVGQLRGSLAADGAWINSTTCAIPIVWADADAPRVTVRLDPSSYQDPALERAWSSVPMPADAAPADCGDADLAIYQRQPDGAIAEWELWGATHDADGWTAKWGGATRDVRTDRGVASALAWTDPTATDPVAGRSTWGWDVSASGIALTAGVITRQDLARGSIDHAVALAVHDAAAGSRLWPAQRTDGTSSDASALPEGAHLRLDPRLDLTSLPMTPLVRMIAQAAQRYGIVVRDKSYSANAFMTEQMSPQDDPVPGLLGGQAPDVALRAFPWASLQVLDAPVCTSWGPCDTSDATAIAVDGTPRVGTPLTLDTRNSSFGYPRTAVAWDLDGDGSPDVDGGTSPTTTWTPTRTGRQVVGVVTRLQDGTTSRGTATVDVAASTASPGTPPVMTPVLPATRGLLGGLLGLLGFR